MATSKPRAKKDSAPKTADLGAHARQVLLDSKAWVDYVRRVYALDPGGHPLVTYVGINFTKERIKNYKFYFSFSRRLSPDELAEVLPVPSRSHFDALYPEWRPSVHCRTLHRGVTFALKVEADGTLTHYYHFRLRRMPFGPPEKLVIQPEDVGNYHGVCEEFTGGKAHLKRYYYCKSPITIAESLRIAGMPDRTRWVSDLEYIESDGRDKLTWISRDTRLVYALFSHQDSAELASGVEQICRETGLSLFAPGSAREGTDHSIYFWQPEEPPHPDGHLFDGVHAFATKYLGMKRFPKLRGT